MAHRTALSTATAAASLLTLAVAFLPPPPASAKGPSTLARDLAALRADVEALSGDLDLAKSELRGRLRTLAAQKADLEMELRRAELQRAELERTLAKAEAEATQGQSAGEALKPAVAAAAAPLRAAMERALPFRKPERLAALDELVRQADEGLLGPYVALGRLWGLVEDELRLGRESGLYRQVIALDGEERLAEVVRVGMVLLYFKTADGQTGRAVPTASGWSYAAYDLSTDAGRAEDLQVRTLFDALAKQIKTGFFELPNALPTAARSSSQASPASPSREGAR